MVKHKVEDIFVEALKSSTMVVYIKDNDGMLPLMHIIQWRGTEWFSPRPAIS